MTTDDAATKFVGYGHADITIDNRFSDKIALVIGTGDHYDAAIHNRFTYTMSENSVLGVGCTYRRTRWPLMQTIQLKSARALLR